ncbi:MAG: Gfo/Idh/MocA family oxidoreductase [Bryobacteraceae bacterium]
MSSPELNRRKFLERAAGTAAAFTIVPRHVLGGPQYVAPSDKVTLAYIGLGTQGIRELLELLPCNDVQVVAVCDPNKDSSDYVDWSKYGIRNGIRKLLGKPDWREGQDGIPGGREVGREIVETYYGNQKPAGTFKGCTPYADFREMFEKQKDIDAVKVMTPDHLHATISIAALNRGKHVMMHKPIANRVYEARKVMEAAHASKAATHFIPWDSAGPMDLVMSWIKDGAIGKLREVHNWSNRPVWPQYLTLPTDQPQVPKDFDWDLWLGPALDRPYHPTYTHAVFRGWYDFGGGAIADMGHYSLWVVFRALKLGAPVSVDARPSTACMITDQVSRKIKNDYSFPLASTIRFKFPARDGLDPVELLWYDGGMKPQTPEELEAENKELDAEGMMFVGDKGKILAGFLIEEPRVLGKHGAHYQAPKVKKDWEGDALAGVKQWVTACRGGQRSPGDFVHAAGISEAFNLGAIGLRMGRRIDYDAAGMKITNVPEANQYLRREYRKGWEL